MFLCTRWLVVYEYFILLWSLINPSKFRSASHPSNFTPNLLIEAEWNVMDFYLLAGRAWIIHVKKLQRWEHGMGSTRGKSQVWRQSVLTTVWPLGWRLKMLVWDWLNLGWRAEESWSPPRCRVSLAKKNASYWLSFMPEGRRGASVRGCSLKLGL